MTFFSVDVLLSILVYICTYLAEVQGIDGNATIDKIILMDQKGDISQYPKEIGCVAQSMFVTTRAIAILTGDGAEIYGTLQFDQIDGKGPVRVNGAIIGLDSGMHAFHIHESGNIGDSCYGAGPLFGLKQADNGLPAGDLGDIFAGANGVAIVDSHSARISLNGDDVNIIGRSIVVHEFGSGIAPGNLTVGYSGKWLACGVLGIVSQEENSSFRD